MKTIKAFTFFCGRTLYNIGCPSKFKSEVSNHVFFLVLIPLAHFDFNYERILIMDMESIEKYTSVSVLTVFATIRGWIGWLIVLYCVAMCTDWLTGTILAIKNAEWNSSKAREGLWHKCGSIFCLAVALLTDLLLSLIVNNIPGMQLTFQYKVMLFPLVTVWYILSELGSILENAAEMGAPIPSFLRHVLEKVQDSCESSDKLQN